MSAALLIAALAAPPGYQLRRGRRPGPYALPPVLADGTTAETWPERRAELVRLFEQHVYGVAPPSPERGAFLRGRIQRRRRQQRRRGAAQTHDHGDLRLAGCSTGRPFSFPFTLVQPTANAESPAPVVDPAGSPGADGSVRQSDTEDSEFFRVGGRSPPPGYAAVILPTDGLAPDDNAHLRHPSCWRPTGSTAPPTTATAPRTAAAPWRRGVGGLAACIGLL